MFFCQVLRLGPHPSARPKIATLILIPSTATATAPTTSPTTWNAIVDAIPTETNLLMIRSPPKAPQITAREVKILVAPFEASNRMRPSFGFLILGSLTLFDFYVFIIILFFRILILLHSLLLHRVRSCIRVNGITVNWIYCLNYKK